MIETYYITMTSILKVNRNDNIKSTATKKITKTTMINKITTENKKKLMQLVI